MDNPLSTITALTKRGFRLTLYRSASGMYWADLRRGWLLRKRVRVDLDHDSFQQAKQILGAGITRRRLRYSRLARIRGA